VDSAFTRRDHADVVVIGGGIVGASAAYHLARLGAGRVLLIEREPLLGTGSTGRCAGGFRCQFSTEINIRLSLESIRMILAFEEELECKVDIHRDGYLFLLTRPFDVDSFRRHISLQNRLGVPSRLVSPEEIRGLAPHLRIEGILAGAYCADDGIADPNGMTQGYAAGARRLGAEIRTGTEARGIRTSGARVEGVQTAMGYLPCGAVVNAAGPHAREVAASAGIDLPVFPERRHVYTTAPFDAAPRDFLMTIDFSTTFYCHRESGGVLMGMGDPEEPVSFNLNVDPEFLARVLEVALRLYPALGNAAVNRAWAGLYEMTPDAHPILGKVDAMAGLFLANGFSGHGFQHAPITGLLVAEEVIHGSARTLDISPLRLERFRGPTTREANVV